MPFDPSFDEIYNLFIADALTEAGYEVFRADDIQSHQNILRDLVGAIHSSDLVIADLTTNNANVFYELGVAHTLGKRVILLTQDIGELPFDLRSYRVVVYSTHFATIRKARTKLVDLAKGARDGTVPFGSPVSDFLRVTGAQGFAVNQADLGGEKSDKGFLDYLADFEETSEELTETMHAVSAEFRRIGNEAAQTAKEINQAKANPSSGTIAHIRKLTQRLAKQVYTFSSNLGIANHNYIGTLSRIEDGLEYMLSTQESLTEDDEKSLGSFILVLDEADSQAKGARDSIAELREVMSQLQGIERHLSRSTREAGAELQQFVENIDQTTAIFQRAKLMARGKLGE